MWALVVVIARASLPYQLDYEEGNILNAAVRIAHGLSPYPDPHAFPNALNPYGPVLYFVIAALVKIFGVTLLPGRFLVIACGIAIAALIGIVVKRETESIAAGIGFGALFLCSPIVQFWWPLLRVDLVGLVLTLMGLVVFQRNTPLNPKKVEWGTIVAGVLFVLAIFTKHTLIAAPAACVVWALLNRKRKSAVQLMACCAVLGTMAFAIGELATHRFLGFALFRMHPDPYNWSAYTDALQQVITIHPLLAVLSFILLIGIVRDRKASLPFIYLLLSALTAFTVGKAGSNFNHVLELIAALCMAAGAGWKYVAEQTGIRQIGPALALLIAYVTVQSSRELMFEPRSSGSEQVIAVLRHEPDAPILSENTGAVVLAGKTPLVSNTFVYTQLVKYGGWSDADLLAMLRAKSIPAVLIDSTRRQLWSKEMLQTLHANYRLAGKFECRYAGLMFVPKNQEKAASELTGKATGNR